MSPPLWVTLSLIASLLLIFIVIGLILKHPQQSDQKITWILITSMITASIWSLSTYAQFHVTLTNDPLLYTIIATIGNAGILVGLMFLTVFWNLLVEPRPDYIKLLFLSGLGAFLIGLEVGSIIMGLYGRQEIAGLTWQVADILNVIYAILIIILIKNYFKSILSEDLSEKQRNQITLLRNGLLFGAISALPVLLASRFIDKNIVSIMFIIVAVTFFYFARAYLLDPRVAFILPHRAYLLIVVNEGGTLMYSKNFMRPNDSNDKSTMLISMGLTAIKSMMSEFYRTTVYPKTIEFEDQKILIHSAEEYFIAVFADRDSLLLRMAMENTAKEINTKFPNVKEVMMKPIALEIDDIIQKAFHFIYY